LIRIHSEKGSPPIKNRTIPRSLAVGQTLSNLNILRVLTATSQISRRRRQKSFEPQGLAVSNRLRKLAISVPIVAIVSFGCLFSVEKEIATRFAS
jgi:hypothetical protein